MAQIIEKNPNVVVTVYSTYLQGIDVAKGIVQAWRWNRRGNALAEILGTVQSSGRLSMSFPETVGQVPILQCRQYWASL